MAPRPVECQDNRKVWFPIKIILTVCVTLSNLHLGHLAISRKDNGGMQYDVTRLLAVHMLGASVAWHLRGCGINRT